MWATPFWQRLYGPLLTIAAALVVYHGWLAPGIIVSGDWSPTPDAQMRDYWPFLPAWSMSTVFGSAIGTFGAILSPQYMVYGLLGVLGVDYSVAERAVFFMPAVVLGALGGYLFSYSLFGRRVAAVLTGLFVVCNTYIAIIDGGGQLLVGVAYAFVPLILWAFRAALCSNKAAYYALCGLFFALQGLYDLRLTYITIGILVLYLGFLFFDLIESVGLLRTLSRIIKLGLVNGIIVVMVHLPWLLQVLLVHGAAAGVAGPPTGYSDVSEAIGLSFMTMSNSLSLMHALWPLNSLGHLTPLNPLLFLVPLVVFALLLRARWPRDVQFLFALSLVSMFFVKGAHEPAGQVYLWFFQHFPGFQWFRDPSKFYQPLMIGMGTLLGLCIAEGQTLIRKLVPRSVERASVYGWIGIWLAITIYPAVPNIVSAHSGTVAPMQRSTDYERVNAMIDRQRDYFRTLWFPQLSPLETYSDLHPTLGDAQGLGFSLFAAQQLPNTDAYSWFRLSDARRVLQALSVKYVIMPSPQLKATYAVPGGPQNLGISFPSALAMARQSLHGFREMKIGSVHIFENPSYLPLVYVPTTVRMHPVQKAAPSAPLPQAVLTYRGPLRPMTDADVTPTGSLSRIPYASLAYNTTAQRVPTIELHSLGESRVEVDVHNATRPYMLLFMQSFDPNWRAYVVPVNSSPSWWALLHTTPIDLRYHMHGEGYANAWWVTSRGSYRIVLFFWPQVLESIGSIVCWAAILGCIGYAVLDWLRRSRQPLVAARAQDQVAALPDTGAGQRVRPPSLIEA